MNPQLAASQALYFRVRVPAGELKSVRARSTMRFIEQIEIDEWCSEHGIVLNETRQPRLPSSKTIVHKYFGQSVNPRGQEAETAAEAIAALDAWDECLLWITLWSIWPSSEDWPRFYRIRGEAGERRSLDIAPGHIFQTSEKDLLQTFLEVVLGNAWDAYVLPARGSAIGTNWLFASHDEWVKVFQAVEVSAEPRAV